MKSENAKNYKYVHTSKVPLSELQCPDIVRKALNKLIRKHPNVPPTAMLNILRVNLGHFVMSKKVKLNFAGEIIPPGQFAMVMLKSGTGKDYTRKDLKQYLFKKHRDWFKGQSDLLYQQMLAMYEEQLLANKDTKNKISGISDNKQLLQEVKGANNNVHATTNNNINPF